MYDSWLSMLILTTIPGALHSRHLLHATYKMYMVSLGLELIALSLYTTYYSLYSYDGISDEGLKLAGRGLEALSTLVFFLLLILLAKGYTVTRYTFI